jgi:hypothetical protein
MIASYLRNLTGVLATGAAFAALPLFASLADLQPPWPPAIGYVSAAFVLIGSLAAWEWTRAAKVRNRRLWIIIATGVTLLGLVSYLTLYSMFIEIIPASGIRVIRGYECTSDALLLYGDQCPDLPRQALQDASWETVDLWTRSSVTKVRLGLAFSWLIFTAGLVLAVGSIVAGRKAGSRRPAR